MDPGFYDKFYTATRNSSTHSAFCRFVFGVDLCQHGFADVRQLELIVEVGGLRRGQDVLDLGCGTGMIDEYLSDRTGVHMLGMDSCATAIQQARARTESKKHRLSFQEGDISNLKLAGTAFDIVLMIDSIYFSADYDLTIHAAKASLKRKGRMLIYYSIGPSLLEREDFPLEILEADKTPLAEALKRSGLSLRHIDVTEMDYKLGKARKAYLEAHKEEFLSEGIGFIYEDRMGDAVDVIQSVEKGRHSRYLYCAEMLD